MEKYKALPKGVVENINFIKDNVPPNSIEIHPWLKIHPCRPSSLTNNPILLGKSVMAGVVVSGGFFYSYDIVRFGQNSSFDIDRYLLTQSGAIILRQREIHKDFPEHHSTDISPYYSN